MSYSMVNVHEAKTHFSKLLARVAEGEEIVVARAGKPVARLVPIEVPGVVREPGRWKGKYPHIAKKDLLDPLPEDELQNWED